MQQLLRLDLKMKTGTAEQELAEKIAAKDQNALQYAVKSFGPKVRGWLRKRFGEVLSEIELAEAFNQATYNVWRFADRFDETKGNFGSWYLRIAYRTGQSILRRETKHLSRNLEYDPTFDPTVDHSQDDRCRSYYSDECVADLQAIVNGRLRGLQRAIVLADLLAGEQADSERLAEVHKTSTNAIKVSRNKARKNIHKWMLELGYNEKGQKP